MHKSLLIKRHRRTEAQPSAKRRLSLENLENRLAPAGNVLATMVGGNLMIRGDGEANGLHLMFNADGTVEVTGVEAGGEATTINGSNEPFVATNLRFVTRVHLGAGDDSLQVESEAIEGDPVANQRLLINVGQGTDTVDAIVRDDLAVHMSNNSLDDDISLETLADIAAELAANAKVNGDLNDDSDVDGAANISTDEAANLAVLGATTPALSPSAVDAALADLNAQSQASLGASQAAQAGLISNIGMNDALGNGALNSNIGTGVSGAFQSQPGILPLG